jgi:peptidoglycan/LPS O-acetylase OafA/YrhL
MATLQDKSASRANNFGSLRLLFAALVVVAHSPEIIDGNRSRELLTQIFGTLSFGGLAVDGFFLVSGYLITQSAVNSRDLLSYLSKRVRRIYPGFIAASLFCILVVAPLAGGDLSAISPGQTLRRLLALATPVVPGSFAGLPYPSLNGSMWTIIYEFKCYLLVALLAWCGVLGRRNLYLAFFAGLAALYAVRSFLPEAGPLGFALGNVQEMIRLAFAFAYGGLFYLYTDRIVLSHRGAGLSALLLLPALFSPVLAGPASILLGGYLTFWFAFAVRPNAVSLLTNRTDPSYGLYLYAWPVQALLIAHVPGISPWSVTGITLVIAGLLGVLSWHLIERPFLRSNRAILRGRDAGKPSLGRGGEVPLK